MKKKIMMATLMTAMVLTFSACGKNDPKVSVAIATSSSEESESEMETTAAETETAESGMEESTQDSRQEPGAAESKPSDAPSNAAQATKNDKPASSSKPTSAVKPTSAPKPTQAPTSAAKPTQAVHTHSYSTPIYKTVHHDAEYKTVHHDAVYEDQSYDVVICGCGAEFATVEEWDDHQMSYVINDDFSHPGNYGVAVRGNPHALVKEAYDEQVLVRNAYDEQVLTGYRCSCGAEKGV